MLKGKLSDEEIRMVRRSFEIIGDVVIIDIPDEILHRRKEIVAAILARHKHVKTILRKVGEVDGVYRVAKYEPVYGGETETIVKEHGCRFAVDPTKAYYSVKLSGERERIARQVRKGERVLVMFAGVGPYPIVIAKLARPKEVIGIELNPAAVDYFRKNIRLNKVEEVVSVIEGDVEDVVPGLPGKFDRVVMPAPYSAENFIHLLKGKVTDGSIIHYYTFESENIENRLSEIVARKFREHGINVDVIKIKKCGNFAPYVNRYVADVEVKF
ncbi:class I SAM-dependent methyltransferase [Archaeoglobus neptunius]|uniref:class I SAM-dependent methyltransferase n=1 Tax=Archaeoglobus neptunius TaxID=2798580 RepID=UPI001E45BAB0|nr:class I SAM-dependent methyltransferase family protein [Archaeoglobus neptunius]